MKRILLYCLVITSFVTSCGKEISIETVGNGPGTGPGGGGGSPNTDQGTYQPFTENSFWKYRQTGAFASDVTITSTGQQRTVNNILCGVFNSTSTLTPGTTEVFFGIKDHDYYTVLETASPNTGAIIDISFLYLNDTAAVGYSWNHMAGTGNGFTAYTPGTVVEKGLTMTIEGKTYKDVVHTKIDLQYDLPVWGLLTFATYDYYMAKNIGIVKVISTGDPIWGGGIQSVMNLVDYSIK